MSEPRETEPTTPEVKGTLTRDRLALALLMEQEDWEGIRLFAAHY